MADIKNRIKLIREFESAPLSTLLSPIYIAALRDCSPANVARDRLVGRGPPFLRIGNRIFYRKRDVLLWLNQHQPVRTTSAARAQATRLREALSDAPSAKADGGPGRIAASRGDNYEHQK